MTPAYDSIGNLVISEQYYSRDNYEIIFEHYKRIPPEEQTTRTRRIDTRKWLFGKRKPQKHDEENNSQSIFYRPPIKKQKKT